MNGLAQPIRVLKWTAVSVLSVAGVLLSGLGLVALVARGGSSDTWGRWSNAGQAFGVLTAVFSGFALAALVITFWMQLQELKAQRMELCQQRETVSQAQAALHRSAEAGLSALHGNLMKLAIDDDDLAAVWPKLQPDLSARRNRQYLYANLIVHHEWLRFRISDYTEAELRKVLQYLFTSPLICEFWKCVEGTRASLLVPDTPEFLFDQVAAQVFREYGGLHACADLNAPELALGEPESEAA